MTVQLNNHSGIDLHDTKQLVDYVLSHAIKRTVQVDEVRGQRPEDQVREGEACPQKIKLILDEARDRIARGDEPFYTLPLYEEDGVIGDPGLLRGDGNHRQEAAVILQAEGLISGYEANVLPNGFWSKLEAALGIPKAAVLVPMNPEQVNPGMSQKELTDNATKIFTSVYINTDVNKLESWLVGQTTRYADDTLKKIAKNVAKAYKAANIGKFEKQAKYREYSSANPNDNLRNQLTWKNKNCKKISGHVYPLNASTSGMFGKLLWSIKEKMAKRNEIRDSKTLQYPATRAKNSLLVHVVPKTPGRSPQDMKDHYAQRLKEMVDFIEAHDEPVDAIYRYPHYIGVETMTKPVKLWGREEGYITDTVLEDLIAGWDSNDDAKKNK